MRLQIRCSFIPIGHRCAVVQQVRGECDLGFITRPQLTVLQKLAPKWNSLAEKLSNVKDVVIAKAWFCCATLSIG